MRFHSILQFILSQSKSDEYQYSTKFLVNYHQLILLHETPDTGMALASAAEHQKRDLQ